MGVNTTAPKRAERYHMGNNLSDILAGVPHEGVRARLAAFAAEFPTYEAVYRSFDYDDDGNVSKSDSVGTGNTADAIIRWVAHLNRACNTPCGWDSTHEEIEAGYLRGYIEECIVGDWGRVRFLTADDVARRQGAKVP